MTVYVIGHQNCPTTAQLLPWSQSCHMVQFLRKSRSTLIFLLAGDSLKKLFDSFAQFFTEQHKKILIILKIDYFYLAGFLLQIMFPKCTLRVHLRMRIGNFDSLEELILRGARINSFFEWFFSWFLFFLKKSSLLSIVWDHKTWSIYGTSTSERNAWRDKCNDVEVNKVRVNVIERRCEPKGKSEKGADNDYRRGGVTEREASHIQTNCPCVWDDMPYPAGPQRGILRPKCHFPHTHLPGKHN